ncbi:MAG: NAD(P)-dependent oxidoreductase, partial [Candidatus Methanofastidiosia archaeon]
GPVVNERALIEALQNKKIRGAALDVFEFEPEVSKELLKLENVILTPHIASASFETREKMALMAVENLLMALKGEKPKNTVNPEVFE